MSNTGPKFSVAGKGGVGKTTITAAIALALAKRGHEVFAIDGDSNNCLGYALGFPDEQLSKLRPLAEMKEELEERAQPGGSSMFLLAPPVADLIDKYSLSRGPLRLLVMGSIDQGGSGCACPLNAALRQVLRELVKRPEAIVVDMEAGVEHLGRGTAMALDRMFIVVEPNAASIRTALRISRLAGDIGVKRIAVIANKIRDGSEVDMIARQLSHLPLAASVPQIEALPENLSQEGEATKELIDTLEELVAKL